MVIADNRPVWIALVFAGPSGIAASAWTYAASIAAVREGSNLIRTSRAAEAIAASGAVPGARLSQR